MVIFSIMCAEIGFIFPRFDGEIFAAGGVFSGREQTFMLIHPGSTGPDVGRLEARLSELGLYTGCANKIYSSSLQYAVKAFQRANGLAEDGTVGDQTWAALFPDTAAIPSPAASPLADAPLAQRCLALTGTFETSAMAPECYAGLAGDFDGQGISFGVLQWNLGQGTLQPLLTEMLSSHPEVMQRLFQENLDVLKKMLASPRADQLAWARSIQDPVRHRVSAPWNGLLKALGHTPEFQAIQVEHAAGMHTAASQLCRHFGVTSERALALMFDIRVQNGSIGAATEALIRADFAEIPASADPPVAEVARLQSIANRRAEASSRAFVEDVRVRKLTIANGSGTVHGVAFDLEHQFGIRLAPADA
jgi:hypothetical protein